MPSQSKKLHRPAKPGSKKSNGHTATGEDAVAMLKSDHRKVEKLFKQYERLTSAQEKSALARLICKELIVHMILEEEYFYPACEARGVDDDLLDEAAVEHDGAKGLIGELLGDEVSEDYYDAKMTVLSEYIKHHVGEEEEPGKGLFAKAKKAGVDLKALGEAMHARKEEILAQPDGEVVSAPPFVTLHNTEHRAGR